MQQEFYELHTAVSCLVHGNKRKPSPGIYHHNLFKTIGGIKTHSLNVLRNFSTVLVTFNDKMLTYTLMRSCLQTVQEIK